MNHYLAVVSSLPIRDEGSTDSISISKTSEKPSLLGHQEMTGFNTPFADQIETRARGVQKSYSDYICDRSTPFSGLPSAKNRITTTFSALSLASSFAFSCIDGASSTTNDSGTAFTSLNNQNNLTELLCSARDKNISQENLNDSSNQQNIYAVSSTDEANTFPHNRHTCSQPYSNIPRVFSSDNISESGHSPLPLSIHNNCTQRYCKSHESVMNTDDTITTYCHAMPISPIKFSSGLECSHCESDLVKPPLQFYSLLPPPLVFPKLVSSVSESGLDAKKLIRCGQLAIPAPPVSIGDLQLKHYSTQEGSDLLIYNSKILSDVQQAEGSGTKMKDRWTMTMNCLCAGQKLPLTFRDAEVQTVIIVENKSVSTSPCLQVSGHSNLLTDVDIELKLHCPRSPAGEVRWDEGGMTWEVYGAAVDPEVLGLAIQKHLEIQTEQNLKSKHSEDDTLNVITKRKRRLLRNAMHSLRQSSCCVRTKPFSE